MREKFWVVGIAAVVLANSAAYALGPDNPYGGGTRLTGPPPAEIPVGAMSEEDRGRIVTERLAACLVKAHRTTVLKAIALQPWAADAQRKLEDAVDPSCLEAGAVSVPANLLRGAFYQQLYREKFAAKPPALPAKEMDFVDGDIAGLGVDAKTEVALRQFGDCVIRRDLYDSHGFVVAAPGSERSVYALAALMPHFSACIIQGSKWTLNQSSISAILSEVLYREAVAAEGPAGH